MAVTQDALLTGLTSQEAARRLGRGGAERAAHREEAQSSAAGMGRPARADAAPAARCGTGQLPARRAARGADPDVVRRRRDRRSRSTRSTRPRTRSRRCGISPARGRLSSATGSSSASPGRDVVRGDLVLLAEGDRVPADGAARRLRQPLRRRVGAHRRVGPGPQDRDRPDSARGASGRPGGDAMPWVFSGTLVVKGHGIALVQADRAAAPRSVGSARRCARSSRSGRHCSARSTGSSA